VSLFDIPVFILFIIIYLNYLFVYLFVCLFVYTIYLFILFIYSLPYLYLLLYIHSVFTIHSCFSTPFIVIFIYFIIHYLTMTSPFPLLSPRLLAMGQAVVHEGVLHNSAKIVLQVYTYRYMYIYMYMYVYIYVTPLCCM
jgi:hypothetical protein